MYEGIESVLREEGYEISVSVTRNRLNDEAMYLKGMLGRNVSGLIIEGTRSSFPNPNLRLYKEIRRRNIPTLFIHNHYQNETFDSVEMSDARAGYELTRILIQNGHTRIGGIFKYDDWQGIRSVTAALSSACRISGSISRRTGSAGIRPGIWKRN